MPRWLWWAPIGLATVLLCALAFRTGWALIHLTETDVINRYAARYLDEAGPAARAADCVASPSSAAGVWLQLRCGQPNGDMFIYNISRFGRLVDLPANAGPQI